MSIIVIERVFVRGARRNVERVEKAFVHSLVALINKYTLLTDWRQEDGDGNGRNVVRMYV